MNEERAERGAMLLDSICYVTAGVNAFGGVERDYIAMGGGDANDQQTTFVDMIADIGHWIGRGRDGLEASVRMAQGSQAMDDGVEGDAAPALIGIRSIMGEIGISFADAVQTAYMHVDAETSPNFG